MIAIVGAYLMHFYNIPTLYSQRKGGGAAKVPKFPHSSKNSNRRLKSFPHKIGLELAIGNLCSLECGFDSNEADGMTLFHPTLFHPHVYAGWKRKFNHRIWQS